MARLRRTNFINVLTFEETTRAANFFTLLVEIGVHLSKTTNQLKDKFNVIVLNEKTKKVVTAIKNTDKKSLDDLGKNYGWRDYK